MSLKMMPCAPSLTPAVDPPSAVTAQCTYAVLIYTLIKLCLNSKLPIVIKKIKLEVVERIFP